MLIGFRVRRNTSFSRTILAVRLLVTLLIDATCRSIARTTSIGMASYIVRVTVTLDSFAERGGKPLCPRAVSFFGWAFCGIVPVALTGELVRERVAGGCRFIGEQDSFDELSETCGTIGNWKKNQVHLPWRNDLQAPIMNWSLIAYLSRIWQVIERRF